MAIKFRDNFANLSAWNVTQITGSVGVSGGVVTFTPAGGAFDQTGMILASPVTLAVGDSIYWTNIPSSSAGTNDYLCGGLGQTSTLNATNGIDFYVDGGSPTVYAFDHPGTTAIGSVTIGGAGDILKFVGGTGAGNAFVDMYIGAANVFTSVNFGSSPQVGQPQYFKFNVAKLNGSSGILQVSKFVWQDTNGPTPPAPSTLNAAATGQTTIDIDWTDVVTTIQADEIVIERSLTSGSGFSEIDTVAIGVQAYSDSGLTAGTTYYYRVAARVTVYAVAYTSTYSAEASATTSDATGNEGEYSLMVEILD